MKTQVYKPRDEHELKYKDAELACIGSLLIAPELLGDVANILKPDHFSLLPCQVTYKAMLEIIAKGGQVDMITLQDELDRVGELKTVDTAWLTSTMTYSENSYNVMEYAQAVMFWAARRVWRDVGLKIINMASDPSISSGMLEAGISQAYETGKVQGVTMITASPMEQAAMDFMERLNDQAPASVLAPQAALNQAFGGYPMGYATIVASRTSIGKTALVHTLADHAAEMRIKTLYVTTEMSGVGLVTRRAAGMTEIPQRLIRANNLDDQQRDALVDAADKYMQKTAGYLYFDDQAATLEQVLHSIMINRPQLVILDHLDELELGGKPDQKVQMLGEAFKRLRGLAKKLNFALVVVHQINRASEARDDKRPKLSDLRWSGDLEQKADLVLLLHREDIYDDAKKGKNRFVAMSCEIAKDRSGERGATVQLAYDLVAQQVYGSIKSIPTQLQAGARADMGIKAPAPKQTELAYDPSDD